MERTRCSVPRRRSQEERRAETRRRLIEATIGCLCEAGYSDTTTTMIARRAYVSRGALQHHFRTRNDLLLAVIEHVGHELDNAFSRSLRRDARIEQRVAHICKIYWDVCRSDAYIAQLQTWIGSRGEPALNHKIDRLMHRMLTAQDRLWQETFSDVALPKEQLIALRRITLAAVRGLALRMSYRHAPVSWSQELKLLRKMVADALNTAAR